jgi:hypothetical protein
MLDNKIKQAIKEAVAETNQPGELTKKLTSWLENLTEGNEQISVKESYARRCEHCFNTTIIHD